MADAACYRSANQLQLGTLHLGHQPRIYPTEQPGLLYQPTGQCAAWLSVPARAAQ